MAEKLVKTLSEQIYRALREEILSQNIPSGTKLTLEALKERFQVSSTPIREALNRLTQDGILTYNPNVGIAVKAFSREEIRELFQLSGDLDCLATRYSLESGNRNLLLADLDRVIAGAQDSLGRDDLARWRAWSDEFHLAFYRHCNNSHLEAVAEKIRGQLTMLSSRYQAPRENREGIHAGHLAIHGAIRAGEIHQANRLMREHMDESMGHALALYD